MLVTLTGVDQVTKNTDLANIANIASQLGIKIEFAILYRKKEYSERMGNRYPKPTELQRLHQEITQLGIQSSIHICGFSALKAIAEKDDETMKLINSFDRAQINFDAYIEKYMAQLPGIQDSFANNLRSDLIFTYSSHNKKLFDENMLDKEGTSVLIDFSGGRGKEVTLEEMQLTNSLRDFLSVGISGGLKPENIADKMPMILDIQPDWIDLESSLRNSDDWFCQSKAIQFLTNMASAM